MPHKTPAFWYKDRSFAAFLLTPFSWIYRAAETLNRTLAKPKPIDIPVIAIGNAVAGGGGKTPTTIALIHLLKKMGYTPHVVTRGYGREVRDLLKVDPAADVHEVGDEPLLLARHAPCWVFSNRREAALMAAHAGATVILMDDGLQHYSLKQDMRICCISGEDGFGNGKLLPAGPLRQPLDTILPTLDANMVIGAVSDRTRKQIDAAIPRYNAKLKADRWDVKGKRFFAFAGIARPKRFFTMLQEEGGELAGSHIFADHHRFSAKDYDFLLSEAKRLDAQLVCTAKDFVRLERDFQTQVMGLDITLHIPESDALMEQLQQQLSHVYNAA